MGAGPNACLILVGWSISSSLFHHISPDFFPSGVINQLTTHIPSGFSDDVLLPEYELLGYAADSPLTPWPVDIRKAYVSRDDKPHVFIPLTHHRLAPKELLRAELMIILGVMLRRMKVPSLKRHRAIPL
jgi:hypothetical protein